MRRLRQKIFRRILSVLPLSTYSYFLSFLSFFDRDKEFNKNSLTFVLGPNAGGWILEAICRELMVRMSFNSTIFSGPDSLPNSEHYFFSHYSLFLHHLNLKPSLITKKCYVFFTHTNPELTKLEKKGLGALRFCHTVFIMNSKSSQVLSEYGVAEDRLVLAVGAADPEMFTDKNVERRYIGLSQAFYERKNPELILELIKSCPELEFLILGRNWNLWTKFDDLISLKNVRLESPKYTEYPAYYNQMKVFLSLSKIEGGPIPLIESMFCNTVPVVTNTGFASDVIKDGYNGFLLPVEINDVQKIKAIIFKALESDFKTRESVLQYSWDNLSALIEARMKASNE